MIFYDSKRNRLELTVEMGRGGEASIFGVRGRKDLVAKIYHKLPQDGYHHKLTWMQKHPPKDPSSQPGHASIAWPMELLYNHTFKLSGYLMPFMDGTVKLINVINPSLRAKVLPNFNWKYLVRTARNLASAVQALHDKNYIIGDMNESNILISPAALVTLIDVDSFQVHSLNDNHVYCCPVGKPEYTPSELQGVDFKNQVRQPESDYFALAVLIFQLLMQGSHPFRGRWMKKSEPPQIAEKIKNGWFPYNGKPGLIKPPPNAPGLEILPPQLRDLFIRCFITGYQSPSRRPSPQMWIDVLDRVEKSLVHCSKGHYYYRLLPRCPWCNRRQQKIIAVSDVKPSEKSKLFVRKGMLYLGVIAHGENTQSSIIIKNDGTGRLNGSIESDRKWLRAAVSNLNIAAGESYKLDLFVDTRTLRKNPRGSMHQAVLKIESNGGNQRIHARIRVGVPELMVEPKAIDFGELVQDDISQANVHIKNKGTGLLTGKVTSRSPWLSVSPEKFSCLPGAGIDVTLQSDVSKAIELSHDGKIYSSVFINSNAGFQSIRTQLCVVKPKLVIHENRVQLGSVSRGEKKSFKIKAENVGAGELRGRLQSEADWLKSNTQSIHIAGGKSVEITCVADTANLAALPGGKTYTSSIVFRTNDGDRSVPVWITVSSSQIKILQDQFDFSVIEKGSVISDEIVLQNSGLGTLHARLISDAPWLICSESYVLCAGNSQIIIPFKIDTSKINSFTNKHHANICVESDEVNESISVNVQTDKPAINLLIHENEVMSSGYLGKSSFRFQVFNQSNSTLHGSIESNVSWLSLDPQNLLIHGKEIAAIGCTIDRGKIQFSTNEEYGRIIIRSNAGELRITLQINQYSMQIKVIKRELIINLSEDTDMIFLHIPSGEFQMGDSLYQEIHAHQGIPHEESISARIFLDEYWIGKYPVTNQQYEKFIMATSHNLPSTWEGDMFQVSKANHPVSGISWLDALAFCEWMKDMTSYNIRLPSEAEWEKAARGMDGRPYPWGNKNPDHTFCNFENVDTTPVGKYGCEGESPYGVADMSGNVWEWTSSQSKPYPYQADDGREDLSGNFNRILRGGSWYSSSNQLRSTYRMRGKIDQCESIFGFRCFINM